MSDGEEVGRSSVTLSLRTRCVVSSALSTFERRGERATHTWIVIGSESGTRSPRSAGAGDGRRFSFSLKLLTALSDDATLLRAGRTNSWVGPDVEAGERAGEGGEMGERASSQ